MIIKINHNLDFESASKVRLLGIIVALHGLFILASTLLDQIAIHHSAKISSLVIELPLLIGLSLIYVATQLRRQKRTAWLVAVLAYTLYLGLGVSRLMQHSRSDSTLYELVGALLLPVLVLALLLILEGEFFVKSDIPGFRSAAKFSVLIILVSLLYGIVGFSLLDTSDFHQEIGLPAAVHYTIDQFDLTTNMPLHTYTKRADIFTKSLTFVSIASFGYILLSLFQPLRGRLTNQESGRQHMVRLLEQHKASSEDFFKLWPHDKQYLFDSTNDSGLAFHVSRGVALSIGDPAGDPKRFDRLISTFNRSCFSNGWLPAFVHIKAEHRNLYEKYGFTLQKIGQEAKIDLLKFTEEVATKKYFRQINNKFDKLDYKIELLSPPHHAAVIERLNHISNEWLAQGDRVERGFVMGNFGVRYIQQCELLITRDAAGTIQAFLNKLPASYDKEEINFDMLRHSSTSPGNINDYLMLGFIEKAQAEGYKKLNLGLCPLVGFDADEKVTSLIDAAFKFAYSSGDRFYSFSGLHRFKAKYRPDWHDRYIAYKGGLRGFSRTTTSLIRSMKIKQ